ERKNATSANARSMSASAGTMYTTTPCGNAWAAAATNNAFAGGVSPDTARAGASMPLRATADFRTARRLREVDMAKLIFYKLQAALEFTGGPEGPPVLVRLYGSGCLLPW